MHQRRLILIILVIALAVLLVVLFSLKRPQSTGENGNFPPPEVALPEMEVEPSTRSAKNSRTDPSANQRSRVSAHTAIETSGSTPPPASNPATHPAPEGIAALFEGVDPRIAARKLREAGEWDYAREYARIAVAENPDSFEALLLFAQLLPREGGERLAAFERLVEIDPSSGDALYGLGQTLRINNQPREAAFYPEAAIAVDPSDSTAHYVLGKSYERMGRYHEALASHKKAFEISQGLVTLAHIQAIEAGNPRIKPLPSEAQAQESEEPAPEGTLPQAPSQKEAPPSGDNTERLPRETESVDKPMMEADESENKNKNAKYQQMLDDLQRMIDEGQGVIDKDTTPVPKDEPPQRERDADRNKRSHSRERHDEDESNQK